LWTIVTYVDKTTYEVYSKSEGKIFLTPWKVYLRNTLEKVFKNETKSLFSGAPSFFLVKKKTF
ncbi:MAG: hypothetical protein AAF757_32115, partial [Cyanobacteria bacterium P01_D01_bin.116]